MKVLSPTQKAVEAGKADAWAKQAGGFAVAELSNGEVDYFPVGQPPNINGEPDRQARIVAKFRWNYVRWSRID